MGTAGQLTVAVRTLCEFGARAGDLDLRFSPSPTALEGIEGHALVASRRSEGYRREVTLSGRHGELLVRGRADGYDPALHRLEEVKTHRGRLDRQPPNQRALHWAQAMVYGALHCAETGCADIELALVYLELGSGQETVLTRRCGAAELQAHFATLCEAYLAWARQERAHRAARDGALQALRFPHPDFRAGQRMLAENVYRAACLKRCLLAQAPTGIGKTVGTVFPLLKAVPGAGLDRVFYLTAKTSGRALALEALATLRRGGAQPLRVLELIARDKACAHPDKACHGESCPLALGFYDRLPAARREATALPAWDHEAVRVLAARHAVCPYYLGQELARWADAVVADYNHWFDTHALLYALAAAQDWRVGLLVDEAHNLVDRARGMYGAELDQGRLTALRRTADPTLKKPLDRLHRRWNELKAEQDADYRVLDAPPVRFIDALQQATSAITDHMAEHPARADAELQAFCFDALHFARLAAGYGEHSLLDLRRLPQRGSRLALRCVVPAPHLQPRFAAAHTVTLFSATLRPPHYHRRLLGLPEDAVELEVASPFDAGQLRVHLSPGLSTRWRDRAASIDPLAARIAAQYDTAPGNYLAFLSSFDYLQQVADRLQAQRPDIPAWRQSRGMTEAEQAAFVARFEPGGRGIGFAVLGGAFGEGIDLPGDRLVGAFVATLGLPQVNEVNEQVRRRLDALFGAGWDFAYLYPGLQKVVQAAGRVIRGPGDRGVLHLLDERFGRAEVRRLLPGWWGLEAGRHREMP